MLPAVGVLTPNHRRKRAGSATTTDNGLSPDTITAYKPMSGVMGGIDLPKSLISMDFQDADVRDVFRLLAIKSSLNVIYGPDITGTISIHLDQVPFDQAFQTVLTLKGLVALHDGPARHSRGALNPR